MWAGPVHSEDRLLFLPSKEFWKAHPLAHRPAENWDQPKAVLSVPVSQVTRGWGVSLTVLLLMTFHSWERAVYSPWKGGAPEPR